MEQPYIQEVVSKAKWTLALVVRTIGFGAPSSVSKQLYVSLVRSKLEYCSSVWGGSTFQNHAKIERVQRAATKFIFNYPDLGYTDRLLKLGMLPLSMRR